MAQQQLNTAKVLIFSKTDGFRHESIPAATEALQAAGPTKQIEFDATEDATRFSDDGLAGYDAVLFLMNTAEVLAEDQTKALQNYLNAGGNFIAIHSASDAVRATPFYGQALGAYFDHHANLQNATVLVADKNHPSTSSLPDRWPVYDEIYYFKSDPRSIGAKVILSVDESSYHDQDTTYVDVQGKPHPLAWYQERVSGTDASATRVGRSWYTSLGHEISGGRIQSSWPMSWAASLGLWRPEQRKPLMLRRALEIVYLQVAHLQVRRRLHRELLPPIRLVRLGEPGLFIL